MESLDDIGCVDDPSDLLRVLEEGRELSPINPPGLYDDGVFLAPGRIEIIEPLLGKVLRGSLVDRLKVLEEGLLVFRCHVLQGVSHLMHDAQLHLCFRKDDRYGLTEPFETIN